MNWIKLNQDYPKAYKLMETEFNCLYTANINYKEIEKNQFYVIGSYDKSIKHPLKRDLYEFFDEQGVCISVIKDSRFDEYDIYYYVINDHVTYAPSKYIYSSQNDGMIHAKARSGAETEAFTKAFEILNDRLK